MTTQNTYLTSSASSVLFLSDLGASENISLIFFSKSDFTFWRWWESSAFGCNSLPTSFSKIKIYYKLHIERGVHAGHSQPISSLKNYEILVSNVVRCKHHPAHPNQAVWILYTKKRRTYDQKYGNFHVIIIHHAWRITLRNQQQSSDMGKKHINQVI